MVVLHGFYGNLIFLPGPNHVSLFKADGELSDLNSKLLLYYTPQVGEVQMFLRAAATHWQHQDGTDEICVLRLSRTRFVWICLPTTSMTAG